MNPNSHISGGSACGRRHGGSNTGSQITLGAELNLLRKIPGMYVTNLQPLRIGRGVCQCKVYTEDGKLKVYRWTFTHGGFASKLLRLERLGGHSFVLATY